MAAACDLCAARLAARLFGTRVARWALLAQVRPLRDMMDGIYQ
jgi:hypothetical protein